MRLNVLFVVALSACGVRGIDPPPHIDVCSGMKQGYAYCVSLYESDNREYRVPGQTVFDEGYVMVSPDHYAKIQKYQDYLEVQAKKRCK